MTEETDAPIIQIGNIKRERLVHRGWAEINKAGRLNPKLARELYGKWQYIYSSDKGKISLVHFKNYFREGDNFYEIYQMDDNQNLFSGPIRFREFNEAQKQIVSYLQ